MRVSALTWSRYRPFKERQRVQLAPITIVIGRNGSGKSVISRLPLLIANAVSKEAGGPLNLTAGDVDHAASYQDLVNMRGALPFTLGAEISDGNQGYGFEATLRYVNETRSLAIEKFILTQDKQVVIEADLANLEQLLSREPLYIIQSEGKNTEARVLGFEGLFPTKVEGQLGEKIGSIHAFFQSAFPMPSYLGPFRAEPARSIRMPSQSIRDLGPRGERALELMADDRLRHSGKLSSAVSNWFGEALGHDVSVDITNDQPQIFVSDLESKLQVGLADTSAGFSQALPIVVQHFAHRIGRLRSSMLIVEQPELHLHPAAHAALADLMINTAIPKDGGKPFICIAETHSEQFIMRIRRRIAEGVDPENVALEEGISDSSCLPSLQVRRTGRAFAVASVNAWAFPAAGACHPKRDGCVWRSKQSSVPTYPSFLSEVRSY